MMTKKFAHTCPPRFLDFATCLHSACPIFLYCMVDEMEILASKREEIMINHEMHLTWAFSNQRSYLTYLAFWTAFHYYSLGSRMIINTKVIVNILHLISFQLLYKFDNCQTLYLFMPWWIYSKRGQNNQKESNLPR